MTTTTATEASVGKQQVLAAYRCDEGARHLVAQRINGKVAVSDVPEGDEGRVYLVERHVPCVAELEALVADYTSLAAQLDRPPLRSDWVLDNS